MTFKDLAILAIAFAAIVIGNHYGVAQKQTAIQEVSQ